jgi:hypothetical protein
VKQSAKLFSRLGFVRKTVRLLRHSVPRNDDVFSGFADNPTDCHVAPFLAMTLNFFVAPLAMTSSFRIGIKSLIKIKKKSDFAIALKTNITKPFYFNNIIFLVIDSALPLEEAVSR